MDTIINRTENGCVFRCQKCNLIHFEYKNLNFNFTDIEYYCFAEYFKNLEGEYWEFRNANNNFNILLNRIELQELKMLFDRPNHTTEKIKFSYRFCSN